ncbi:MAG: type II toxin-antitoxin system HicB family antitoxin [Steroidobacteraceae bacterium]
MDYLVVIEESSSGYGAYVPDLPGCVAVGDSRREVMKLIREGIKLHREAMRHGGEDIPKPTTRGKVIRIRAA